MHNQDLTCLWVSMFIPQAEKPYKQYRCWDTSVETAVERIANDLVERGIYVGYVTPVKNTGVITWRGHKIVVRDPTAVHENTVVLDVALQELGLVTDS